MNWLKIYLPAYLLLYLLIAFVVPTYRTFKKIGINPITFGKTDNAHDYIGFVMKLLIAFLFVAVLCFSFSDKLYYYTIPISYLSSNAFKIIGLILIHISLIWIGIAQYQMSNSWRIGIDEKNKTELVIKGVFFNQPKSYFFRNDNKYFGSIYDSAYSIILLLIDNHLFYNSNTNSLRRRFLRKTTQTRIYQL